MYFWLSLSELFRLPKNQIPQEENTSKLLVSWHLTLLSPWACSCQGNGDTEVWSSCKFHGAPGTRLLKHTCPTIVLTGWLREALKQKALIKKKKKSRDLNPLLLVAEWDGWSGRGILTMMGINSNLMIKASLTFRNLLTQYWVEVLTWDLRVFFSSMHDWGVVNGVGGTLVMGSVIKKAQNWARNKVWLCMQVSPAICLLDIRISYCSTGEITYHLTVFWVPLLFNSCGNKAPRVAGRRLWCLEACLHFLLVRRWRR